MTLAVDWLFVAMLSRQRFDNIRLFFQAGETVLTIATEHAKDDVVQLLVNLGADATVPEEVSREIEIRLL